MDVESLLGTMIRGSLGGRRKHSHGAGRFLAGSGSAFLNASTLLTVGGLIWGAIETMQQQAATPSAPAGGTAPGGAGAGRPELAVPPPLPGAPAAAPPPVPDGVPATAGGAIPEGAARLVKLMVSAARADGTLGEAEQQTILEHARQAGAEALVAGELGRPTPLAEIVAGVSDGRQRADLYVLAFAIVRADESVSGAERIYLAQLASLLALDAATAASLEREVVAHIDRLKAQG